MEGLVWEDPPLENRGGGVNHQHVAQQLRTNPGAWARVSTYATAASAGAMAQSVRRALLTAYQPEGAYEAVSRTVEGKYYVYARYVGRA